jgi:hypothetical protein
MADEDTGLDSGRPAAYGLSTLHPRQPVAPISVPESHLRLRLRLHTTGAYAVEPDGPDSRVNDSFDLGRIDQAQNCLSLTNVRPLQWKPLLSGRRGRILLLTLPWVAVLVHRHILGRANNDGGSTVLPALLAISLVRLTAFLIAQQQRREELLKFSNQYRIAPLRGIGLVFYRVVLLFVVAPLLCMPITARGSRKVRVDDGPKLFTFNSWEPVVRSLNGTLPTITRPTPDYSTMRPNTSNEILLAKGTEPWGVWGINQPDNGYPVKLKEPYPARSDPFLWDAALGYGTVQPFQSSFEWNQDDRPRRWQTNAELLTYTLDCEVLDVATYGIINRASDSAIVANLTDTDGCFATVELPGVTLRPSEKLRFQKFLHSRQSWAKNLTDPSLRRQGSMARSEDDWHGRLSSHQQRLGQYISSYESAEDVVFYSPAWIPSAGSFRQNAQACARRHIFVGTADPFLPESANVSEWALQAASCSVNYATSPIGLNMSATAPDFSYREMPSYKSRSSPMKITRFVIPEVTRQGRGKPSMLSGLPGGISTILDDTIRLKLPNMSLVDGIYAAELLEYQLKAGSSAHHKSHHTIVYGGKLFLSGLTQLFSTASSFALADSLDLREVDTRSPNRMVDFIQTTWWFQVCLYLACFILTVLVLILNLIADNKPSGLPWDISTISARILLLCDSKIMGRLGELRCNPQCDSDVMRSLRIGWWPSSDDHQTPHWRVDSLLYRPRCKLYPLLRF